MFVAADQSINQSINKPRELVRDACVGPSRAFSGREKVYFTQM